MLTFNKDLSTVQSNVERVSIEKVKNILSHILSHRFPGDTERQRIVTGSNGRLNFCCCYCGDSHDNPRKKRGHYYSNWMYFKCYNGGCEKYVDLVSMASDFGVSHMFTDEELSSMKISIAESREASKHEKLLRQEISLNVLVDTNFEEVLVPRKELMQSLGLMEVHQRSPIGIYLSKRLQTVDERFAWDYKKKRLFIFNLDPSKQWIFSLQTRQFDNDNAKYLTYSLSSMWSKMMNNKDEEFLEKMRKYDHISTIFNVLTISFNHVVTLFEGPLDSFLFQNSVGMCSINNSWPFDIDNYRWFQDNDEAGKKKALEALNNGRSIFMWKKFIDDFELHGKKIKDYNDIVVYSKANNVDFGDLEKYFSTHKYDGIFL